MPFLAQEHQQQVASAIERAKQVTMTELNAIIGVSFTVGDILFLLVSFSFFLVKLNLKKKEAETFWFILIP